MNVTLFMAMSVNGLVAREDGSEDFLSHENWETFSALVKEFGNFIVGSKTYEAVGKWDEKYNFDDFPHAKKVVVSHELDYVLKDGYYLASSPENAITFLKQHAFDRALLAGGAANNASFARAGLIDEIIVNVEPCIIGTGIPLFRPDDFQFPLKFVGSQNISNGLVQLHYQVVK